MAKIIIVGAGILGASTAYELVNRGSNVLIVDRNDLGQATNAAAGIVCPWLSQRRNQAWYSLAKAGARYYPSLIEQLNKDGETETGYAKVGAISLQTDSDKLAAIEKRAIQRKTDAPEIEEIAKLTSEETRNLFPPLSSEYSSVYISGAARVDGSALRDCLLRAAQKKGAKLIDGDAELLYIGETVNGVKVGDDVFSADKVIICAGAWANQLVSPLGFNLNITFQKAQIAHVQLPNTETNQWPVVIPPNDQYLLSFDDNRIVIGATHQNTTQYDTRLTAGGLREVFDKALQTAPGLDDSSFLEARVGFRPFTPNFLPIIGPLPNWQGILIANGLGASGLTMGPYLGSQLAKLALDLKVDIDLEKYKI